MPALPTYVDVQLTGRIRHRTSLFGKQIMQVEEKRQNMQCRWPTESGENRNHPIGRGSTKWRDAKFDDLQRLTDILAGRTAP